MHSALIPLTCLLLIFSACEGKSATTTGQDGTPRKIERAKNLELPKKVEVAKTGTNFEPPVEVSDLPGGIWYCDMDTVHYASREKGDGKCPRCSHELKPLTN